MNATKIHHNIYINSCIYNRKELKYKKLRRNRIKSDIKCSQIENQEIPEAKEVKQQQTKIKVYCYGCGIEIQTEEKERIGYIEPEKFKIKKTHKQYDQLLCERCISLTQGEMIPGVKESFLPENLKIKEVNIPEGLISADDLRLKLKKSVRNKKVLVVFLVDLLDIPGSFLNTIRNIIGQNPMILIGTKFDLLPKNTDPKDLLEWLGNYADSKKLTVIDIKVISSKLNKGINRAMASVMKNRKGRDVYVIGLANVGKSAFIRAIMKDIKSYNFDLQAFSNNRFLPVESKMPGTTLGIIKIDAFPDKKTLYDTPGIHVSHRLTHLLSPKEMKLVHPTRSLKAYIPPSPLDLSLLRDPSNYQSDTEFEIPEHITASYYWAGLIRIDIVKTLPSTTLVFYGPPILKVFSFPLPTSIALNTDFEIGDYLEDNLYPSKFDINLNQLYNSKNNKNSEHDFGDLMLNYDPKEEYNITKIKENNNKNEEIEYFGKESVMNRGGLVLSRKFEIDVNGYYEDICDISVSGLLGWISVKIPKMYKTGNNNGVLIGRVWAPKGVEVFVRRPIPVPNPMIQ